MFEDRLLRPVRGMTRSRKRAAAVVAVAVVALTFVVAHHAGGGGRGRSGKPAAAASYTPTTATTWATAAGYTSPPTTELPAEASCMAAVLAHHGAAKDLHDGLMACVGYPGDGAAGCIESANESANGDVFASAVGSCLAALKPAAAAATTTTSAFDGPPTTATTTTTTAPAAVEVSCWKYLAVSYGGASAPFTQVNETAEATWVASCVAAGGPPQP